MTETKANPPPGEALLLDDGTSPGVRWPDPNCGPWFLRAHWGVLDDQPECVGLELWKGVEPSGDGRYRAIPRAAQGGIEAQDLRGMALGRALAALWEAQRAQHADVASAIQSAAVQAGAAGDKDVAVILAEVSRISGEGVAHQKKRSRRSGDDRDHFEKVASVYRGALVDRRPPTMAVVNAFGCSHPTAARWVARARDLKLLAKTTKGRPSRPTGRKP